MSAEKWAALREPFPSEHVQHRPGGGGQLAYVSHGHVTDRLLTVDPEYNFEPLLNADRVPIVVLDGLAPGDKVGVWAVLRILGTSVVEFCSGKDLMDAYSRCLCRAAMRRGVALDLWAGDIPTGEVRKEGGLGPAPVFRSWVRVQRWYDQHGGNGAWELAQLFVRACSYHLYGQTDSKELTSDQRKIVLQKAAGATAWLAENSDNAIGPLPPSVELYQKAWAHVLDGAILEVPEWQPKDMPAVPDDEAERLADEAIVGPPE